MFCVVNVKQKFTPARMLVALEISNNDEALMTVDNQAAPIRALNSEHIDILADNSHQLQLYEPAA